MIFLASVALGIFFGIRTAKKRNGNRLDMAQYAFGFAIAFGLLGAILTIVIERLAT